MKMSRCSADLRNHYSELSKLCRENHRPVYITVNGRDDTVLLGIAEYEQMCSELELLRTLAEAEEDVRMGRVAPIDDTLNSLRESLLAGRNR